MDSMHLHIRGVKEAPCGVRLDVPALNAHGYSTRGALSCREQEQSMERFLSCFPIFTAVAPQRTVTMRILLCLCT